MALNVKLENLNLYTHLIKKKSRAAVFFKTYDYQSDISSIYFCKKKYNLESVN